MELKGIDVSSHNGKITWSKVKKAGVQFAILRCHQKFGIDDTFEYNYAQCKKQGIPVGVYKYSYAMTAAQARTEAEDVAAVLQGKNLDLPVFYDLEEEVQFALGPAKIEKIALAFLGVVSAKGYKVGIYCNKNWYSNAITPRLRIYDCWIASPPMEENDNGSAQTYLKPAYGIAWQYSWKGSVPGINGNVDMDLLYKDYVSEPAETVVITPTAQETVVIDPGVTADDAIGVYRSWIGLNRANGSHQVILDIYNDFIRKHPAAGRGVLMQPWDPFCAATYSAAHIKLGAVDAVGGVECGVEELVKICQKTGTWEENGAMTPEKGWGIVFNWDDSTQPNTGFSDHIGIVESVDGGQITCIEGNMSGGVVGRRQIPVGWGYIRGFIKPKYGQVSTYTETVEEVPTPVQKTHSEAKSGAPSKDPKWVGRVTADWLNVRTWAGTENPNISSWPVLARGNLVDVCDTVRAADGSDWYYIRIAGKRYGFVSALYIAGV